MGNRGWGAEQLEKAVREGGPGKWPGTRPRGRGLARDPDEVARGSGLARLFAHLFARLFGLARLFAGGGLLSACALRPLGNADLPGLSRAVGAASADFRRFLMLAGVLLCGFRIRGAKEAIGLLRICLCSVAVLHIAGAMLNTCAHRKTDPIIASVSCHYATKGATVRLTA